VNNPAALTWIASRPQPADWPLMTSVPTGVRSGGSVRR
jgi:hypothetical protein